LNHPGDFLDTRHIGEIDEGAMSRKLALASLTALIAAAALSCGAAQAQQLALVTPPPNQIAPPAATPSEDAVKDSTIGDENAQLPPRLQRQIVDYPSREAPGTVIIDTPHTYLYFVLGNGKAIRYGIGVGRDGFTWSGVKSVVRKTEWPDWYPPAEMIKRQPYLPRMMAGGPGNPLGARAMYIGGTEYRIHGTNDPTTIGKHVSSGCIRMTNDNAIDLYSRVKVGAKVIVLPQTPVPTRQASAPAHDWQAKAAAAIVAPAPDSRPAPAGRERMSWNGMRANGLY
jgi:lipoprotein-anchoring transpeptidase ErfK/SrfK